MSLDDWAKGGSVNFFSFTCDIMVSMVLVLWEVEEMGMEFKEKIMLHCYASGIYEILAEFLHRNLILDICFGCQMYYNGLMVSKSDFKPSSGVVQGCFLGGGKMNLLYNSDVVKTSC